MIRTTWTLILILLAGSVASAQEDPKGEGSHVVLRGRVVEAATGRPLAGVKVIWTASLEEGDPADSGISGPDGAFAIEEARPGRGWVLVSSDLYRWVREVDIPAAGLKPLVIRLPAKAAIRVRFLGRALPDKDVKVVCHDLDRKSRRSAWLRTAEVLAEFEEEALTKEERPEAICHRLADAVRLESLRPGRYRVEAIWDGKPLAETELRLAGGEIRFVEFGPGHAVSGVWDEFGGRVALPTVKAMSEKPVPRFTHFVAVAAKPAAGGKRYFWDGKGPYGLDEMKAMLHLHSWTQRNSRTKFSEIRVVIGADARVPFMYVQRLMALCAHRDVQVWRISFAVQRVEPDGTAKRGRIRAYLPTEALPSDKIRINLARRRSDTICYVQGRAIGLLPACVEKLGLRLATLHDGPGTTVFIDPSPMITHQDVVTLLETCRGRNIDNVAFAPIDKK